MARRVPKRLRERRCWTLGLLAVLLVSSCSVEEPTPDEEAQRLTRAREACEQLFSASDESSKAGPGLAERVHANEVASYREVAEELKQKVDHRPFDIPLCSLSDPSRDDKLFRLEANWSTYGDEWAADPRKHVVYTPFQSVAVAGDIRFKCVIEIEGDKKGSDSGMVRLSMYDALSLDSEYRKEILFSSARKIETLMGCANDLDFSSPYVFMTEKSEAPPEPEPSSESAQDEEREQVPR